MKKPMTYDAVCDVLSEAIRIFGGKEGANIGSFNHAVRKFYVGSNTVAVVSVMRTPNRQTPARLVVGSPNTEYPEQIFDEIVFAGTIDTFGIWESTNRLVGLNAKQSFSRNIKRIRVGK